MTKEERMWTFTAMVILLLFAVWLTLSERQAALYRQDRYTECIAANGENSPECTRWESEW